MKLLFSGKTKDIYEVDQDTIRLKFKDDVTGVDGVFDPGANGVGLQITGIGNLGLQVTSYFFNQLQGLIPTHYISSDVDNNTMDVKRCTTFGKGLEVICRCKAGGSFVRRYGSYIEEGEDLGYFVEFTIKDDERNDPPITKEALILLNIMNEEEYMKLVEYTTVITRKIREILMDKGMVLHDIKYEFGIYNHEIILIDEISAGSMRVSRNGCFLSPIELSRQILE